MMSNTIILKKANSRVLGDQSTFHSHICTVVSTVQQSTIANWLRVTCSQTFHTTVKVIVYSCNRHSRNVYELNFIISALRSYKTKEFTSRTYLISPVEPPIERLD